MLYNNDDDIFQWVPNRNISTKYVCRLRTIYTYVLRIYNNSSVAAPMFEFNVQFAQTILCYAQLRLSLCLVVSEG